MLTLVGCTTTMEGMFIVNVPIGFANVRYTFVQIFVQMKLVF
jgi:hypothetical protein